MRAIILCCILCFSSLSAGSIEKYRFSIVHPLPEKAVADFRQKVRDNLGYTLYLSDYFLRVSVPLDKKQFILTEIRRIGYVDDEKIESTDPDKQILTLKTRLKNKQNYLKDLYKIFNKASFSETLEMELELNHAIQEVEGIKGKIKKIQADMNRVLLEVDIKAKNPQTTTTGRANYSQFGWINNLGVSGLYRR